MNECECECECEMCNNDDFYCFEGHRDRMNEFGVDGLSVRELD